MRFLVFKVDSNMQSQLQELSVLEIKELSKEVGHRHGEEAYDEVA